VSAVAIDRIRFRAA